MPDHQNVSPPLIISLPNFRDIGGVTASDGKKIRKGLLYRSGDLSGIDADGIHALERLQIRMIIDFRSDSEVLKHPTPVIRTVEESHRIIFLDSSRTTAERMLQEDDGEGLRTLLLNDYRRIVNDHHNDLRTFFRVLTETDQLPLVFHCAAGKDRTGIATYLLMRALDVDDRTAREDYLLSNIPLKPLADKVIGEISREGKNGEILRPLLEVRESYLDSAIDEIGRKFGDFDRYLSAILNVDRIRLREKYLE